MIEQLNTLARTLNTLVDVIRTDGSTQNLVLDLQEHIQGLRQEALALNEQLHAAAARERAMQEEIESLTKVRHAIEQLELKCFENGTVVLDRVDGADEDSEKRPVYYCVQCAQETVITYLQFVQHEHRVDRYACLRCQHPALIPTEPDHNETLVLSSGPRIDFTGYR